MKNQEILEIEARSCTTVPESQKSAEDPARYICRCGNGRIGGIWAVLSSTVLVYRLDVNSTDDYQRQTSIIDTTRADCSIKN